jgi:hypothetical protein
MQGGVPIVRTLTAPPNTPAHLKFERKYMAGADKHTFHTGTHNMDFNRYYSNHSPSADIDNNKKDMSKYSLICQQFNNIGGSKHLHTVGMKSSSGEYAERAINHGVVALYGQENLFLATSHPLHKDNVGADEDDGIVFRFLTNFPVTNTHHPNITTSSGTQHQGDFKHGSKQDVLALTGGKNSTGKTTSKKGHDNKDNVTIVRDHLCILRATWQAPYSNGSAITHYIIERRVVIDFHGFDNSDIDVDMDTSMQPHTASVQHDILSTAWESFNSKACSFTEVYRMPEDIDVVFLKDYFFKYLHAHADAFECVDITRRDNQLRHQQETAASSLHPAELTQANSGPSKNIRMTNILSCFFRISVEMKICAVNEDGYSDKLLCVYTPRPSAHNSTHARSRSNSPANLDDRHHHSPHHSPQQSPQQHPHRGQTHSPTARSHTHHGLHNLDLSSESEVEPVHLCDVLVEQLLSQELLDIQSSFVRSLESVGDTRGFVNTQGININMESLSPGKQQHGKRRKAGETLESSGFLFPSIANTRAHSSGNNISSSSSQQGMHSRSQSIDMASIRSLSTTASGDSHSIASSHSALDKYSLSTSRHERSHHRRVGLTPMGNTVQDIEQELHKATQIIQSRRLKRLETLIMSSTSSLVPAASTTDRQQAGPTKRNSLLSLSVDPVLTGTDAGQTRRTSRTSRRPSLSSSKQNSNNNSKSFASELLKGKIHSSISTERVGLMLKDFLAQPPSVVASRHGGEGSDADSVESMSISSLLDVEAMLNKPQHRWEQQSESNIQAYEEAHIISMEATAYELTQLHAQQEQQPHVPSRSAKTQKRVPHKSFCEEQEEEGDADDADEDGSKEIVHQYNSSRDGIARAAEIDRIPKFIDFKKSLSFGFPRAKLGDFDAKDDYTGESNESARDANDDVVVDVSRRGVDEKVGDDDQAESTMTTNSKELAGGTVDFAAFLRRLEQSCPLK